MLRFLNVLILASVALLSSCHTHEVHVIGEERGPVPDIPVVYYLDPQAPISLYRALPASRPPEEIPAGARDVGRFRVLDGANRHTARELADEARRRGGDAVVVDSWKYGWVGRDRHGRDRRAYEIRGRLIRTR